MMERPIRLAQPDFDPFLNDTFQLMLTDQVLNLELVEITALRPRPVRTVRLADGRELHTRGCPFSLIFRGPTRPALEQRMYTLDHPKMGTLEGIFLVPIDQDVQYRYYQTLFN